MSRRGWAGFLRAGTALGLLVIATAQASAGGFGIREQSAYGQGTSFAGIAAGGALSSMFWNPATMTQVPGIQSETAVIGPSPLCATHPGPGSVLERSAARQIRQSGAFVPAGYTLYQFSPNLWLGLSINAPFGLSVNFPDRGPVAISLPALPACIRTTRRRASLIGSTTGSASAPACRSSMRRRTLTQGLGPPGLGEAVIKGNGWGYGFTAGVTLTPTPTTTIGVGYRSAINQKIDATLTERPAAR